MRFQSGLYLLGEDCVILNEDNDIAPLYQEALEAMEPFGQIVDVEERLLPRRVQKMIEDQRNGWFQSLGDDYPLLESEFPEFPEIRESEIRGV